MPLCFRFVLLLLAIIAFPVRSELAFNLVKPFKVLPSPEDNPVGKKAILFADNERFVTVLENRIFTNSLSGSSFSLLSERKFRFDHSWFPPQVSRDGQWLITPLVGGALELWNLNTGSSKWVRSNAEFADCRFSLDSKILACGNTSGYVSLYDLVSSDLKETSWKPSNYRIAVRWSQDSQFLYTMQPIASRVAEKEDQNIIRKWDLNSIRHGEVAEFETFKFPVKMDHVELLADGSKAIVHSDKKVSALRIETQDVSATLHPHAKSIESTVLSPNGLKLITSGFEKVCFNLKTDAYQLCEYTVKLWDVPQQKQIATLFQSKGLTMPVEDFVFSPNSEVAAGISQDTGKIYFWMVTAPKVSR